MMHQNQSKGVIVNGQKRYSVIDSFLPCEQWWLDRVNLSNHGAGFVEFAVVSFLII